MLRITHTGTAGEERWILSGQLAGLWVLELRSCLAKNIWEPDGRRPVLDLTDVTFIDESGESLLRELRGAGVDFVTNGGVATRDLIENLRAGGAPPVRRSLGRRDGG